MSDVNRSFCVLSLSLAAAQETIPDSRIFPFSPPTAQDRRPSMVRHVSPTSGPHIGGATGVVRGGRSSRSMNTYSVEDEAFAERQRGARWEHTEPPQSISHEAHMRHTGDRVSGSAGDGGRGVNAGNRYLVHHDTKNDQHGSEPAVADEMFGFMAPCWRLLERAKTYMDQVRVGICSAPFSKYVVSVW